MIIQTLWLSLRKCRQKREAEGSVNLGYPTQKEWAKRRLGKAPGREGGH